MVPSLRIVHPVEFLHVKFVIVAPIGVFGRPDRPRQCYLQPAFTLSLLQLDIRVRTFIADSKLRVVSKMDLPSEVEKRVEFLIAQFHPRLLRESQVVIELFILATG